MGEIQSLARGIKLLDTIANSDRAYSITELAEVISVDKSSASRLVKTLVNYDYLQQKPGSRGYVLGKRLHRISWRLLNRYPIREKARPFLYRLVRETGECSHTAVFSEGKALMIDDVEAEASLRVVGGIGRMLHLHCTAVGKGLLAFGDYPIPSCLPAHTAHTITDPETLLDNLEQARRQGYALDDEENEMGVRCIAAPVYGYMGATIATVGISGPTPRVTLDRIKPLAKMVMQVAKELSAELGYTG